MKKKFFAAILGARNLLRCGSFVVLIVGGAVGCRFAARPAQTESGGHAPKDLRATPNQIRLRMRALVGPMCGEIEKMADRIITESTNRTVQRAALNWKIEAVPEMREALFQPDPLTALVDSWVLCSQMVGYFETGPGKAALGDFSPAAAATCRGLEERLTEVAATTFSVSGDVSKVRAGVGQWAADHPIKHSIIGRETSLSRMLERDAKETLSTGEVMADLTTSVDDLERRLAVYSQQLVRQARWEADLFKMEIVAEMPFDQTLPLAERAVKAGEQAAATADRLAPAIERAVTVAENTPKLIASEREAVIKALQDELIRTIKVMQEERVVALAQLTRERVATLNTLGENLEVERKLFVADIDHISLAVMDRAVWRIAQLATLILVAVFISAVLLLLLTRRLFPPSQNGPSHRGLET